ncbi:hypothetical protein BHYA_0082g00320 [Botrytis hyacinthi]|uniref:Uncharacterized protein n=1 Tax=Botrytis hyacinthi TaxID=278943 RepID=A0A4Z1GRC3_9HELO|nr:hypothetical protein BHYA_0082g00320 [Botrytis hyacinthi]
MNRLNLEQNTAAQMPYYIGGKVPLDPQDAKQLKSGDTGSMQLKTRKIVNATGLVLHTDTFTNERILTNDPTHHEIKNPSIKDMMADWDARIQKLEQFKEISSEETRKSEAKIESLEIEIQKLKDDKKRRHAGEVINIRDNLAKLFLSSKQNKRRKQREHDPKDMKAIKEVRNQLAHEIDLDTTLEQIAIYPDQFDICSINVFGETQNKIREMLTWDKDRECRVYIIFNEHGEAWYIEFANTCIQPFKKWLSAMHTLKETESAMLENPFQHCETPIQEQKDRIKEAIREWNETFMMDKSKRGKSTKICPRLIKKDYQDRELMAVVRASLLRLVVSS